MSNRLLVYMQKVGTGIKGAKSLHYDEAYDAMNAILDGEFHPVTLGGFLLAMRWKPETAEELAAFADAAAARLIKPDSIQPLHHFVDCAGAYNGKARTLNISVGAAIVAAAAGAIVLLHGSMDIPTKRGMTPAHILTRLGVQTHRSPEQALVDLLSLRIAYLHQTIYNPILYALTPLRNEVGKRTLFNTIEPLLNPLNAPAHIGGFVHRPFGELVCQTVQHSSLGFTRVVMICGIEGSDEVRPGRSLVVELRDGVIHSDYIEAEAFGLQAKIEDANTSNTELETMMAESVDRLLSLLEGDIESGYAQIVILNAAVRLYAAGAAASVAEGVEKARQAITSGAADLTLRAWRQAAPPLPEK